MNANQIITQLVEIRSPWRLWNYFCEKNPGFSTSLKSSDFPQISDLWPGIWKIFGPTKGIDFISWQYRDQTGLVETNLDNYHMDHTCRQNHCSSLESRGSGAWWLRSIKAVKTESGAVDHSISREFPSHFVSKYIKAKTLLRASFSFIEIRCRKQTFLGIIKN